MNGVFVSAVGTGVGKTTISTLVVRHLRAKGVQAVGVKPIETGCQPFPADAVALAEASADLTLAHHAAWYRAAQPLAPYAVTLTTGQAPPDVDAIATAIAAVHSRHEYLVVEGAGGLYVPLDADLVMIDLIRRTGLPVLVVAEDVLGVLSHVLGAVELIVRRELLLKAVVLNHTPDSSDASSTSNARILRERISAPVFSFPSVPTLDAELWALAMERSGLAEFLLGPYS
jgi:dethiobiotin synthetase